MAELDDLFNVLDDCLADRPADRPVDRPEDCPEDRLEDCPLPLSNPPASHRLLTHKYDNLADLMDELHEWAALAGFGVRKKRSNNYVKDFGPTRIDISCARDAICVSNAHGSRQTSTTKCGCS